MFCLILPIRYYPLLFLPHYVKQVFIQDNSQDAEGDSSTWTDRGLLHLHVPSEKAKKWKHLHRIINFLLVFSSPSDPAFTLYTDLSLSHPSTLNDVILPLEHGPGRPSSFSIRTPFFRAPGATTPFAKGWEQVPGMDLSQLFEVTESGTHVPVLSCEEIKWNANCVCTSEREAMETQKDQSRQPIRTSKHKFLHTSVGLLFLILLQCSVWNLHLKYPITDLLSISSVSSLRRETSSLWRRLPRGLLT